uniref:Uncharacterized protein n=1 Tax=Arundo donax TaxID=35708 RepID=A0A0A9B1E5_ARUDO
MYLTNQQGTQIKYEIYHN